MTSLTPLSPSKTPKGLDVEVAVPSHSQNGRAHPAEVELIRFESFEAAAAIREDWDKLVERVGGDMFNTFDWCATWWNYFGHQRTLALFTARHGDRLVAVWPLFRETIWWGPVYLRVVRVVGCDHGVTTCNLSTEPEMAPAVASQVLEALETGRPWDLFHVGEIPGYAANVEVLVEAFRQSQLAGQVHFDPVAYPHAVFDVPGDYEAYLAGLSLKERRNVRHDERELSKQGGSFFEPREENDIDAGFDLLIDLHQKHWSARGRHGLFDDVPGIEAFHRELAKKCAPQSRLALVEVRTKEEVLASEYALRFNGRLHWIIGGRKENVSSRIGFCSLMHSAVRDGLTIIDGLPGSYDYKRRLAARTLSVKTIWCLPRSRRGRIRLALTRGAAQVASFVYHRAWYWHAAPWLAKHVPHVSSILVHPGVWQRFARSKFLVVGRVAVPNPETSFESAEATGR